MNTPQDALDALFRENALPMSDRNGVLYDEIAAALAAKAQEAAPAAGAVQLNEAQALTIADNYGQRWKAPDEEGISFEKSHFFMFLADLLTEGAAPACSQEGGASPNARLCGQ